MANKSKCKWVTTIYTCPKTKQKKSSTYKHGGSFGGPGKVIKKK